MKLSHNEINQSNTWQIGTGDDTRAYYDIFLKYGVALVGPGTPGKEGDPNTKQYYKDNSDEKNWGAELKKVKHGEWIIARKGRSIIIAIGKVMQEYDYSNFFADVEGWDLQHFVKVQWFIPQNEVIKFSDTPLSMATMQRCANQKVFDKIYEIEFKEALNKFEGEDFPFPKTLSSIELIDSFIDRGIRIQDAENVNATIQRIIRLAKWYQENDPFTLESEIIAFLVNPLFIALGWSEQQIKLGYKYTDVTLFDAPFKDKKGKYTQSPTLILEAKTFSNGLAFTNEQIEKYGKSFPECKKFLVTNGFRYKYFEKQNGRLLLSGYFNLLDLSERNVLYDVPNSSLWTILEVSNF